MKQEEKLEEAKRLYETANADQKYVLERLFPELRESEDERIRKELISFLKSPFVNENITDEKVTPWIAWLEKQKERSPLSKDEEYTLARIIEYLEDNDCPSEWKDLLHDVYALPYQKEQKPWSEEDKSFYNYLLGELNASLIDYSGASLEDMTKAIDWFKSLKNRVKPKQEWKPSDLQIKALKEVCDGHWEPDGLDPLYTLWEQLSKLREE